MPEKLPQITHDIALARRICDELKKGNTAALHDLQHLDEIFRGYLLKRGLYQDVEVDDVLSEFKLKRLIEQKAICRYTGEHNARLATFLCSVLEYVRRNMNTAAEKRRKKEVTIAADSAAWEGIVNKPLPETGYVRRYGKIGDGLNVEKDFLDKWDKSFGTHLAEKEEGAQQGNTVNVAERKIMGELLREYIDEAKALLREISEEDAGLLDMWEAGMTAAEMATKLGMTGEKNVLEKLRQRVRRAKRRYRLLLNRLLSEENVYIVFDEDGIDIHNTKLSKNNEEILHSVLREALFLLSEEHPMDAQCAAKLLEQLDVIDKFFFFSKDNNKKIKISNDVSLRKLQKKVDVVLYKRNLRFIVKAGRPKIVDND